MSQTAEGSALSVQLLEEREKQLTELLALEKLSRKLVRTVRKSDKAQDRIRFRIFSCQVRLLAPLQSQRSACANACLRNPVLKWVCSCVAQNRHEEAIEFGDLSDASEVRFNSILIQFEFNFNSILIRFNRHICDQGDGGAYEGMAKLSPTNATSPTNSLSPRELVTIAIKVELI